MASAPNRRGEGLAIFAKSAQEKMGHVGDAVHLGPSSASLLTHVSHRNWKANDFHGDVGHHAVAHCDDLFALFGIRSDTEDTTAITGRSRVSAETALVHEMRVKHKEARGHSGT